MEALNQSLFLWINAPANPSPALVALAILFARWLIWLLPLGAVIGFIVSPPATRRILLAAGKATAWGVLISLLISHFWYHPRPFAMLPPLGHQLLAHAPDASFPSHHLTPWWAFAFCLCFYAHTRLWGWGLVLLGLPMAWARIYLGVHFPFDMLGAAVVGALCAGLNVWGFARFAPPHSWIDKKLKSLSL